MEILSNIPLAPLTTIRLGGSAQYFTECTSVEDISSALEFATANHLPVHILSGGSNTIFPDAGFPGLVLKISLTGINHRLHDDCVYVTAQAGENWDDFVAYCVTHDWVGLEALSGIPGYVGATPIQNVGAYGCSVGDLITSLQVYDTQTHSLSDLSASDCQFTYRSSRFKTDPTHRYIITAVTFALHPHGQPQIKYPELAARLSRDDQLTVAHVRDTVLSIRGLKGMTTNQTVELHSCGSFFTNPIITLAELDALQTRSSIPIPHYTESGEKIKVSAAWLIEQAGFTKGERRGGVGLSPHHILALVNYNGTTTELLNFAQDIIQRVQTKFGITLEPEPIVAGAK